MEKGLLISHWSSDEGNQRQSVASYLSDKGRFSSWNKARNWFQDIGSVVFTPNLGQTWGFINFHCKYANMQSKSCLEYVNVIIPAYKSMENSLIHRKNETAED